jgi:hypothetical protein
MGVDPTMHNSLVPEMNFRHSNHDVLISLFTEPEHCQKHLVGKWTLPGNPTILPAGSLRRTLHTRSLHSLERDAVLPQQAKLAGDQSVPFFDAGLAGPGGA